MLQEQQDILQTQIETLAEIRKNIKQALAPHSTALSTDTARYYNATLYHIQAAREELKRIRKSLQTEP